MVESWSPEDHLRHWMYDDIFRVLSALEFPQRLHHVLDFGSKWYGDEDGGWRTHMRTMLKSILQKNCMVHTLAVYPQYDIEDLRNVGTGSVHVLIADQVLEHVQRPWRAAKEIARVVTPGGLCVVGTPGLYPIHPSPVDCWRIMPDGYDVLFPLVLWRCLTKGMWGTAERVAFEYGQNGAFPEGPPTCSVADAKLQPAFTPERSRYPLMVWFIGRRTFHEVVDL